MDNLEQLAVMLSNAKVAENAAKKTRIECEEKIAAMVETEINGSKTVEAGERMKITVKRGLSYKADMEALLALEGIDLPVKKIPAKDEFDEKAYEAMLADPPNGFVRILNCVTVKPKKVSVTIKLV